MVCGDISVLRDDGSQSEGEVRIRPIYRLLSFMRTKLIVT